MYVHRSNRMEVLVDELARVLHRTQLPPLAPEIILIQSRGMERWLGRELAKRLNGFANARFPFPRSFIQEAMDVVLGPASDAVLYERDVMSWAIADLLAQRAQDRAFASVSAYWAEDSGAVKRVQLAERIAYLFDQYLIYRPKMILEWEAGRGSDWQAALWRALVARYDELQPTPTSSEGRIVRGHFASRAAEFERRFSPLFVQRGALPARLSVVGGASLPPLFLRLLGKLSECMDVHLFSLAPSREYLGPGGTSLESTDPEEGGLHPLLSSLGSVAAAFQQMLESQVNYVDGAADFVDVGSDTVLHALQSDLLSNRIRRQRRAQDDAKFSGGPSAGPAIARLVESGEEERLPRRPSDDSIRLVSCHSPMREVEVLRDRLLELFATDPNLSPDDVVVMAPRIEGYVPLIDAVFASDPRDPQAIPYRIADRSERRVNAAAEALLRVLALLRSRFKASEVLDLLQAEPVRRKFGIDASDLPDIYHWVHDAGIRWGEDAAHRQAHELPPDMANTWRFGLNRLLLGYALSDDQRTRFADTVPYDQVSGDRAELLGRFVSFCETLFRWRHLALDTCSVESWCKSIRELTEALLEEDEGASWQIRPIHEALHELASSARRVGFDEPVSLEVISSLLNRRFEDQCHSAEFVSGGVTFCAMLPLRSIPFRVVYLLGMNDGEFPRIEQQLGFDKLAERPQLGDRSQRAEDRYLFLETLLSARERLIVSYVGRGIQDNEELPPAIVVSELIAAVEGLLEPLAEGQKPFLSPIQHPLQPFSPRAFDGVDPALASYSETYALGARALVEGQALPAPLFTSPLEAAPSTSEPRVIELRALVAFFKNPARALLRHLGLYLDEDGRLVDDREPVESDALVRYFIGSRLMAAPPEAQSEYEETELARGALPAGAPGRITLGRVARAAEAIRSAAAMVTRYGSHDPLVVTVRWDELPPSGESLETRGSLEGLYWSSPNTENRAEGLRRVECSYARIGAKHELAAWIVHLAGRAAGVLKETVLIGRGAQDGVAVKRFVPLPVEQSRQLLGDLVTLFEAGHRAPLPLFPTLSRSFVERVRKAPDDPEQVRRALASAQRELLQARPGSDGADIYVQWAFRGMPSVLESDEVGLASTFAEVSQRVFEPLLDHLEELDALNESSVDEAREATT